MNKVTVRAPVRADLAGGTLDLWPLYLFHPGSRTVNVAISFYAESEVSATGDGAIEIHLSDQQYRQRYESLAEMAVDPKAALLHRALEHFNLNGVRIVTRTDAPRGSGLGGSSALTITLVRALSEIAGEPVEGEDLIVLVRDLETRLLGVPAGVQDYYPPVFGGLSSLHLDPGRITRHPLTAAMQELGNHMLLHYTGVSHFSGTNNWELYKRQVEGKKKVQKGLSAIAETAQEMERALEASNFEAAGAALQHEWENRKALIDGISTPEIEAAVDAAREAGAWGGKVCGAGGGGCIVFLFPPERRDAVRRALSTVPGQTLDVAPVSQGLTISRDEVAAPQPPAPSSPRPRAHARHDGETLEQLYVSGGAEDYRPFILAEAIITHTESRSGVHHQSTRTFLAPLSGVDGNVLWHQASIADADQLDIRATPDKSRRTAPLEVSPEGMARNALRGQETFKAFLEQNQKLQIFYNPAFGIYSEPLETREAFIGRCMEEANRQVEKAQERLESTFRRRIDQLRERSERERREMEKSEDHTHIENQELNVAWGQTLYNITSGRRPASADPNQSVRETDYMDNIAQIQKAWDRELDTLRDDLTSKARSIEEMLIVPTPRNIEITKYLILWT